LWGRRGTQAVTITSVTEVIEVIGYHLWRRCSGRIASEAKFILSARRFNVTLTRARSKFIMLVSDALVGHLPADADVARDAAHLQLFVQNYCSGIDQSLPLPFRERGRHRLMRCRLRGYR
jgi:hypothetical protein